MKKIITLVLLLAFLFPLVCVAQQRKKPFRPKQRFEMGLLLGMNLSQIDGDDYVGYDKVGVIGGIEGVVLLTRRMNIAMQLLYNQKGARVHNDNLIRNTKERILQVDYAEVPLIIRYQLNQPDEFRKTILTFEGGITYGRLINTRIEEEVNLVRRPFTDIESEFNSNEFSMLVGISVEVFKGFNLGVRGTSALSRMYLDEEELNRPVTIQDQIAGRIKPYSFLRNYYITLYARYDLY